VKILIPLIALIALLGITYGLAKFHVLPVQKLAQSSPALGKLLIEMKLYTPAKPHPKPVLATEPAIDPLAAQKALLAAQQAQIEQQKQALAKKAAEPPPIIPTAPQLVEIYESMNSDDLANLFSKQPNSAVVSALIGMDTKKAGKALSAMPPDRAAKLTALMNQAMASQASTPPPPAS
jgi:flagellar motility protein MotE (MotC chaperone)